MRRRRWLPGVVLAVLCVAAAADRGAKAPQRVIQYGPTRTATTLQFQMLCAIMFLVQGDAGDVSCVFKSPARFPGLAPARRRAFDVIKMHRPMTSRSGDDRGRVWLFATSNGTTREALEPGLAGMVALGYDLKLVQTTPDLAKHGLHESAFRLADVFGLDGEERRKLWDYVRYWDVLRTCCGPQMSQDWYRQLLAPRAGAGPFLGPRHHARDSPSAPACEIYDLDAVEVALMRTHVFRAYGRRAAAIRRVSAIDGDLNGTYCTKVNAWMAARNSGAERFKDRVGRGPVGLD